MYSWTDGGVRLMLEYDHNQTEMNAATRAPYLEAGDTVLGPLGFKRKKRDYLWNRANGDDIEWIHLNFGIDLISPSYGVTFRDIEASYPQHLDVRCGVMCLLQGLTGASYSGDRTPPSFVARDLLVAVEQFPKLRDRQAWTEILMSEERPRQFVILNSHRMHMLPALLANLGRIEEAQTWLAKFEGTTDGDQSPRGYAEFAEHFRLMHLVGDVKK